MLYRNVLVSHLLRHILGADQSLIQVLSNVSIASGYLYPRIDHLLHAVFKIRKLDLHLLDQLRDQAVLLMEQSIQQMLLLYLLISCVKCYLLEVIHCLYGFLCKFTDIHKLTSSYRIIEQELFIRIYQNLSFAPVISEL